MVTFRYLGISFFELTTGNGVKILIDPCITKNVLCPIVVDDVTDVDLILVTHGAPDHMGDAIEIQKKTGATLVSDSAVKIHAERMGVENDKVISILWGDQIEVQGVTVKAVECRHINLFQSGDRYLSGIPLSFIIHPEDGVRIYNAGDTALFSDLKLIGRLHRPNIALIPIGGAPELTGGYSHLPPQEASLAAQWIGADVVIPTHYQPDAEEVAAFTKYLTLLAPSIRVLAMKPGDTRTYDRHTLQVT
ncbi:MAG: metal-dependent hydrolase [Candidatus Bathyarchaeota archaeon]|nr:metal-dependent hydrolase [Candidatus Bathyarchaeota archaeon]